MDKNRLEAFSDGVIAIVITIMVLELKQPASSEFSDFVALAPTLLSYLLSFMFVAIYWVNHHLTFNKVEKVNVKILWCNIFWLFVMSFIPFVTAWVGSYPTAPAPLSIYFGDACKHNLSLDVLTLLCVKVAIEKILNLTCVAL